MVVVKLNLQYKIYQFQTFKTKTIIYMELGVVQHVDNVQKLSHVEKKLL